MNNSVQTSLSPPGDLFCLSAIRFDNVNSQHATLPCACARVNMKKRLFTSTQIIAGFVVTNAQMQIFLHSKVATLRPTRTEHEHFSH